MAIIFLNPPPKFLPLSFKNKSVMILYYQEDIVAIEITGKSWCIRKYSKSEAFAKESFLRQVIRLVISITTKSE